jgi:hypothetical protein
VLKVMVALRWGLEASTVDFTSVVPQASAHAVITQRNNTLLFISLPPFHFIAEAGMAVNSHYPYRMIGGKRELFKQFSDLFPGAREGGAAAGRSGFLDRPRRRR